ncbi:MULTISPECIES: hypothetical protein [unclassified Aeromonas]|jgi:hypothetical protein|nr:MULTISPECIES: hypothetical protein [unclassified Aeromonas]
MAMNKHYFNPLGSELPIPWHRKEYIYVQKEAAFTPRPAGHPK